MAQRLVRKICTRCKREQKIDDQERRDLDALATELGTDRLYRGAGCEDCRRTGYRGRTGLFELLVLSEELRELVIDKKPSTEIKQAAMKNMLTIRQDGLRKAVAGITTLEEVLHVAIDSALE